jgi:hypothetical protein
MTAGKPIVSIIIRHVFLAVNDNDAIGGRVVVFIFPFYKESSPPLEIKTEIPSNEEWRKEPRMLACAAATTRRIQSETARIGMQL